MTSLHCKGVYHATIKLNVTTPLINYFIAGFIVRCPSVTITSLKGVLYNI